MTKHQTISLKLAQWLKTGAIFDMVGVDIVECSLNEDGGVDFIGFFNPFASTTEGRAQFAECVIKADVEGIMCLAYLGEARQQGRDLVEARIEAIYFAIGGEKVWE